MILYYTLCPGCNGTGIQIQNDGIKVICPICNGSGKWKKVVNSSDNDYYPNITC